MSQHDISVDASGVRVEPKHNGMMTVEVMGVQIADVIEQLGQDNVLDWIGKEACIKYFDIEEATDE